MAARRRRAGPGASPEERNVRVGAKGKNFSSLEEEQLCKTVMFVFQDSIVGNQQRAGVFWNRIFVHYNENKPDAERPQRSLESKWGIIKHDVSKFCGVYAQIERLNRSGSNTSDTLRKAKDLYRQKDPKKADFAFEHCWNLLKGYPRWADGWCQLPMRKRPARSKGEASNQDQEPHTSVLEGGRGGS